MLEPVGISFLNSPSDQNMALQDENARLHPADTTKECKNQNHIASLPWPSSSPDFEPQVTVVGRTRPTSLKPGTSRDHYSRALPSSVGEVRRYQVKGS